MNTTFFKISQFFTVNLTEAERLNYSSESVRRIQMVNNVSFFGIATIVFYAMLFGVVSNQLFISALPYFVVEAFLTLCIIFINNGGHYNLAKTLIATSFSIFLAFNTQLVFGNDTNTEIFVLMFSLIPLFLWSFRETKYLVLTTMVNLGVYVFIAFVPPVTEPKVPIPLDWIDLLKHIHFFSVFFGIAFAIAIFHKYSSQKEEQLLKQANELKKSQEHRDLIYSIIAHDLRSPFNGLIGLSDLLLNRFDEYDNAKKKQLLESINTSSTSLNNLLENLLQWSRMHTNSLSINFEKLHLKTQVSDIVTVFTNVLRNKNLQVVVDVDETCIVLADANMLSAIVRNILSNAIKFTPTGGTIKIDSNVENNWVQICISDSGIGIPQSKISDIFSVKSNYTQKGTNQEKGTGLGLKICKEFVEAHGGSIWVESIECSGTRFYFTLKAGV